MPNGEGGDGVRCPHDPRMPGCAYQDCSDNVNCIEKPWVKDNLEREHDGPSISLYGL